MRKEFRVDVSDAEKSDLFDALGYVAFTAPPVSREARAEARLSRIFKAANGYSAKSVQQTKRTVTRGRGVARCISPPGEER